MSATPETPREDPHGGRGEAELRRHVGMVHELAADYAGRGKLILARFGEDPETDKKSSPLVRHFEIGDAAGMLAAIRLLGSERDRNLYIPLAVMRPDLTKGQKGFERDVVVVLGLVADFDDGAAADYDARLPLPPNYVLETSPGRFQTFYLLDAPTAVAEVKAVAEALKAHAGCDHGTADLSHVWRIPGTLNWPTRRKLAAGRAREPVPVRVALPWDGSLTGLDELRAALPAPPAEPAQAEPSAGPKPNGLADAEPEELAPLLAALPEGLRRRIVDPTSEGQRSEAINFVVRALLERGVAPERIETLMRAHPQGIGEKYDGRADLDKEIERIRAKWRRDGGQERTSGPPERVTIQTIAGELDNMTAAAAGVLGDATRRDPFGGYYRRGSLLVRTVRLADDAELHKVKRARGTQVIEPAEPDGLRLALTAACRWEKYDARSEKWRPRDAPATIARTLIATAPRWDAIPILTGIAEAPTLRPDGTVLDRPGYDPATGLLFDSGGVEFPPVPERPSRGDALAALEKLKKPMADFRFADDASESVAVSALMTPLVRKACRAAPLHVFNAHKMGSGKTLLASLPGYIATGRAAPLMSQADDPAEEKKRLLAVLIEGQPIAIIDNVERELKSDALCTILTEPVYEDRILGVNKKAVVKSAATFFATGNNIVLAGDLTSRALACTIDPGVERPEEREFDVNLHIEVPKQRAELAVAALTIVRAYLAAGEPKQKVPNFARFEDWCRFVRYPLMWLDMTDPCASRKQVEGRDPVRGQLGVLLTAWHDVFGDAEKKAGEAIEEATREPHRDADGKIAESDQSIENRKALHEALAAVGTVRGSINPRSVGRFLSKHERRIEGGFRFENAGEAQRAQLWRAVAVGELVSSVSYAPTGAKKMAALTKNREPLGANSPNSHNSPEDDADDGEVHAAHDGQSACCAYCGHPEKRGMPLNSSGNPGKGGTLMHPHCRANWQRERQADAEERAAIVEYDGEGDR